MTTTSNQATVIENKDTQDLPPYVSINDPNCPNKDVLRKVAEPFQFPLSDADKKILKILEAKFDNEVNMTGLAAPQIGFSKRAIIFAVIDSPEIRKWRPDISDTMPKTIWLNPTYEPTTTEMHEDGEACFSVKDFAVDVPRYKSVRYTAYTTDGKFIEGHAKGFLARAIQHEVDHLNGILFMDLIDKDKLLPIEEYRRRRAERMQANS